MTQVDFNVIVAITSIGIWSKIIQTHFLLTQDLIITSSFIHSCSENAFLQCRAQKTIFDNFEQQGMGSGMFQWSNRSGLLNLSLIYEIMMICGKKVSTLSTGNLPRATMLRQFWPQKAVFSTGT